MHTQYTIAAVVFRNDILFCRLLHSRFVASAVFCQLAIPWNFAPDNYIFVKSKLAYEQLFEGLPQRKAYASCQRRFNCGRRGVVCFVRLCVQQSLCAFGLRGFRNNVQFGSVRNFRNEDYPHKDNKRIYRRRRNDGRVYPLRFIAQPLDRLCGLRRIVCCLRRRKLQIGRVVVQKNIQA